MKYKDSTVFDTDGAHNSRGAASDGVRQHHLDKPRTELYTIIVGPVIIMISLIMITFGIWHI